MFAEGRHQAVPLPPAEGPEQQGGEAEVERVVADVLPAQLSYESDGIDQSELNIPESGEHRRRCSL